MIAGADKIAYVEKLEADITAYIEKLEADVNKNAYFNNVISLLIEVNTLMLKLTHCVRSFPEANTEGFLPNVRGFHNILLELMGYRDRLEIVSLEELKQMEESLISKKEQLFILLDEASKLIEKSKN